MVTPGTVVSPSEETLAVVLAVVFGVLSFARTAAFRRRLGRNPWGLHPNLWLVVGFLLGPIGAALAFLACATTRVGPAFGPAPASAIGQAGPAGPAWSPPPPPQGGPPPGWYPDPSGRHEYRFFTGHDWTSDVVDNGAHSTEPLPPPPGA
jgi:hypothetical protein